MYKTLYNEQKRRSIICPAFLSLAQATLNVVAIVATLSALAMIPLTILVLILCLGQFLLPIAKKGTYLITKFSLSMFASRNTSSLDDSQEMQNSQRLKISFVEVLIAILALTTTCLLSIHSAPH